MQENTEEDQTTPVLLTTHDEQTSLSSKKQSKMEAQRKALFGNMICNAEDAYNQKVESFLAFGRAYCTLLLFVRKWCKNLVAERIAFEVYLLKRN
jgi:hypothetical protein